MKFGVIRCPTANPAQSPFRIIERTTTHEVEWANRFLDRECLRRVTNATLYGYAYHLLHFIRWWVSVQHTDVITESALTESTLLDCRFVRTINTSEPRGGHNFSGLIYERFVQRSAVFLAQRVVA